MIARRTPRLVRIQDPAAALNFAEHSVTASRFRVNAGEIQTHGHADDASQLVAPEAHDTRGVGEAA